MTFDEWARTGQVRLLKFATVLCGGRHLAEDVVQEVLVRVDRKWDSISRMNYPDTYIHRMVVNEFLSWRRKWARIEPRGVIEVAQISRFSSVSNGVQIKLVRRSAAPPEVISLDFEWPPTIPASPGQVVTINGRQAKIANGNSLTINFEGYGFALDAQLAKLTDPKAELIAITKALRLVDPPDQSTWFPAQVGLP